MTKTLFLVSSRSKRIRQQLSLLGRAVNNVGIDEKSELSCWSTGGMAVTLSVQGDTFADMIPVVITARSVPEPAKPGKGFF